MAGNSKYELVNAVVASVDASSNSTTITQNVEQETDLADLTRQLIMLQSKQNALLQELVNCISASQRQRNIELAQWRQANPALARSCKVAADRLGKIQSEFLAGLSAEIDESFEDLQDSEYLQNEFFDKYGPRIVHLNTLLQTLAVLGNAPEMQNSVPNS